MQDSQIRVLVLHAQYTPWLSYYDDWLEAFCRFKGFRTIPIDIMRRGTNQQIRSVIREVDAVVLLHSTNGDAVAHIKLERHLEVLGERRVPLLAFVGNEVNLPGSPITEKRRVFAEIQPEWIATQLLHEAGQFLFGDVVSKGVVPIPHALNHRVFRSVVPDYRRPIDFGTRSARYLPHLGDDDRMRILNLFTALKDQKFVVNISHDRLDRAGWARFLNRCKGTVSTEAGSWYLERDDRTVNEIRDYLQTREKGSLVIAYNSPLWFLSQKFPRRARAAIRRLLKKGPLKIETNLNEQVDFAEIHDLFFTKRKPPEVYGKCISSRHFEAAGTKTCQILLRGRFNDILLANRHYLALDQDFGNLNEVLLRFSDPAERKIVAETCHEHILTAHTFDHRMRQIYQLLSAR